MLGVLSVLLFAAALLAAAAWLLHRRPTATSENEMYERQLRERIDKALASDKSEPRHEAH